MIAIDETLNGLPPQARQQVLDFVEFLAGKYLNKQTMPSPPGKKILDYAGAWEDMEESEYQGFINDIYQRRENSGRSRRNI